MAGTGGPRGGFISRADQRSDVADAYDLEVGGGTVDE